jgi:endonuclease/exonuclease/phosphatase family metal-dependent hydrolase
VIEVVTWNVLHRVHAVNWKEAPLALFPDERARIEGIRRKVASFAPAVVCLQEVSGDQRAAIGAGIAHTYPRVPRLRQPGPAELVDPTEHLLTIADGTKIDARTFDSDPGKGFLAVDVGAAVIVNTHVSFRGAAQMALLAQVAGGYGKTVIVLGDFNAELDVVRAALRGFVLSEVKGHTRVATEGKPAHTIDHVAVLNGTIASAEVLDGEGLSDHLPVRARVVASAPRGSPATCWPSCSGS